MGYPTRVNKPPIIEVIVEIQFSSTKLSPEIFGLMYSLVGAQFPSVEKLPILEIPPQILSESPDMACAVHYRMKNDKYVLSIG